MPDEAKQEIELTDDLLDFIRRSTIKLTRKQCPPSVDPEDVVQQVLLNFVSKPPVHDPARGASVTSLLYTILQRQVWKIAGRARQTSMREQHVEVQDHQYSARGKFPFMDLPLFDYIACDESREMCRLLIAHDGNYSEVAREMKVAEGTVRYRIKNLAPKLLAAGFDPFGLKEANRERCD
jgi:DNA-directed RNA polymerase specialized sigma24 family protein